MYLQHQHVCLLEATNKDVKWSETPENRWLTLSTFAFKHILYFWILCPATFIFVFIVFFFAFCKSLKKKKLITYLNRLVPHPGWQATTCPVRGNALGAPLLLPSSPSQAHLFCDGGDDPTNYYRCLQLAEPRVCGRAGILNHYKSIKALSLAHEPRCCWAGPGAFGTCWLAQPLLPCRQIDPRPPPQLLLAHCDFNCIDFFIFILFFNWMCAQCTQSI